MEQRISSGPATKRDYEAGIVAGLLIGFLILPILATAVPSLHTGIRPLIIVFFLVASPIGIFIASKAYRFIPIFWQIAKFVLIGILNTLVDLGILAALQSLFRISYGINPETAIAVFGTVTMTAYVFYKATSFFIANVNSFFWNKYWTFSGNPTKKSGEQFIQFLVVSIIGFLINIFFSSFVFTSVTALGGMNPSQWGLACAALGSVTGLAWNFVGYKLLVFKK
ncbi:MAG: GtrA family protein [Candidatus Moranbacteria bacterium]|nr:GtrA family protein [Candidatus Moranbacteria bacterium]